MINIYLLFKSANKNIIYVELKKDNSLYIKGAIDGGGRFYDNTARAIDVNFDKQKAARASIKKQWRAFKSDYIKRHGLQNVDLPAAAAMFTIKK